MPKIIHTKGTVTYAMRTGKTFVRNKMPLSIANSIIKRGKDIVETDVRGDGIELCVDDKYFFPIEIEVKETVEDKVKENE